MLAFITNHPVELIVALIIIVAIVLLVIRNRKDVLIKAALYIVAKVEEEWGSNMGRIKFAEAYSYLKTNYPVVTFFIPQEKLSDIIEQALVTLKQILASKEAKAKLEEEAAETAE